MHAVVCAVHGTNAGRGTDNGDAPSNLSACRRARRQAFSVRHPVEPPHGWLRKKVLLPSEGSVLLQWPSQSEHDGTRVAGCAGAAAGVSDRGGREREGPVAAGRPLVQMSPGRWAASSFILPRSLPAATGLGLRCAGGRHVFWKAVGGSGAGPRCPWRRNKGGGGGRRPTPEDIRRKGYRGPAPDTPTAAPGKRQCTFLHAPQMGEEPKKNRTLADAVRDLLSRVRKRARGCFYCGIRFRAVR